MKTWEYRTENITEEIHNESGTRCIGSKPDDELLNDLGGDGWKLISLVYADGNFHAVFRRPKEK